MSKTIWKYPIPIADVQDVAMPEGARILCVQTQGELPCLWALVDPTAPPAPRKILIAGTGHTRDDLDLAQYLGTFQLAGGALIFHVFENVWESVTAAIETLEAMAT